METQINYQAATMVFTRRGFLTRVLPRIATLYGIVVILVFWLNRHDVEMWNLPIMLLMPFVFVFLPQLVSYWFAFAKHKEFEKKYGSLYRALVSEKKIWLSATAILLTRSPARYEKLLNDAAAGARSFENK
jgi:hypothetical protein